MKEFIIVGTYDNYAMSDKKHYSVRSKDEHVRENHSIREWQELVTNQRGEPVAQCEKYEDERLPWENRPWMEFDTKDEAEQVAVILREYRDAIYQKNLIAEEA